MIELSLHGEAMAPLWETLVTLSSAQPSGWTLVGAQMVALHGLERRQSPPRATVDADLLMDVRAVPNATENFSGLLLKHGFELVGIDANGVGHRFQRERILIDVLAPEGIRRRPITIQPAHTVSVPGGTQALRRTVLVEVSLRGKRLGKLPRPDLLGAILVKIRAIEVDDVPDAQRRDVAFLLSLVEDPRVLADQLRGDERSWLKRHPEIVDPNAAHWRDLGAEQAENAQLAFRLLAAL